MDKKEFLEKRHELEILHEANLRALSNRYALSNNPHKEGETIRDEYGFAKIVTIKAVLLNENEPCCVYTCKPLNKDHSIKKGAEFRNIYQFAIL
jgi:hypothetical protein